MNHRFLFLFFISFLVFSQKEANNFQKTKKSNDGFEIVINTKNLKNEKILLQFMYDVKKLKYIADSTFIKSDDEKVVLKSNKKILGGIYFLKISSQKESIELALDNGAKINSTLISKNINDLIIENNLLNKDFLQYQRVLLDIPREQRVIEREKLRKKYANSVLDYYFQIENKALEKYPEDIASKNKYWNNYFLTVSKTDKRLFLLPNVFKMLNHFINIHPINNENYIKNIDFILKGFDCKSKNYIIFVKWFATNLSFNEMVNLDASYIHLFNNYINKAGCDGFNPFELNDYKLRYEGVMKLPKDSKVPDFELIDHDKKVFKLSEIYPENDYTFITFFSPNCDHCQENIPKVSFSLKKLLAKFSKKVKLISVLNDIDDSKWEDFVKTKGLSENWLNLKSPNKQLSFQEVFHSYTNPNYLFIDKQGKILLKSYNSNAIEEYLKKN